MQDFVTDIQARYSLPGLVIGILRDREPAIHAFGYLSDDKTQPATSDTAYGIGSISKVFTATLAMCLVNQGKLDLHRPVIKYVPDLPLKDPASRETVTMHHLLTHRGGFEGDGFIENGTGETALSEWVETFTELDQVTPAGAVWSYSNTGIGLAGHVLAAICGSSFEDALRQHVLTPLKLYRTGFGQPPAMENSSMGYEFGTDGSREPRAITGSARSANPAGGLVSTVPDLLRFAAFHLGRDEVNADAVLSMDLRAEMQRPQADVSQIEKWGIGWGLKLEGTDTWTVEHGGWFNGFRAQLTLLPEMNAAFAILTTGPKGHEAIEHLQEYILENELNIRQEGERPKYKGDKPDLSGTFVQSHLRATFEANTHDSDVTMLLKTKWHGADSDEPIRCPLKRISEDEYVVTDGEFVRSHVTYIDLIPGTDTPGVRVLNRICLPE